MSMRVPVAVGVAVVGVVLAACCALWAVAVNTIVPNVCEPGQPLPVNAGPVRCGDELLEPVADVVLPPPG